MNLHACDAPDSIVPTKLEERSARAAPSRPRPLPLPESVHGPEGSFLNLVEPLIRETLDRLEARLEALSERSAGCPFAMRTVMGIVCKTLPAQLLPPMSPTMALELNIARLRGELRGDSPEARYRSFVAALRDPDRAASLLGEYSVLARQLSTQARHWEDFFGEVMERLCDDWEHIRATFGGDGDPGELVAIDASHGDPHRRGRRVLILSFRSGFALVYKPRSLAVEQHFQDLLGWLNARGWDPHFRPLKILDRGDHGWVEFLRPQGCETEEEVHRFYLRQGGYLAVLYALEATDFHHENLIAVGEDPVLLDLEALLEPRVSPGDVENASHLAQDALGYSVLRTGLLPQRIGGDNGAAGVDLSGLGAGAGQATPHAVRRWEGAKTDRMALVEATMIMAEGHNRPKLGDRAVDASTHAEAIVAGFTRCYRLLERHKAELLSYTGPIRAFAHDPIRVILRPTRVYGLLLHGSYHPDYQRDPLHRDRLFDRLRLGVEHQPYLARVVAAEQSDLERGDIPLFTATPSSCAIVSSAGVAIDDFFAEPSLAGVERRIEGLCDADREQQTWFVRASLAALCASVDRSRAPASAPVAKGAEPDPVALLGAARAIGDRLASLAYQRNGEAAWLGLRFASSGQCSLAVIEHDLYGGLLGVAFFLAHLGVVTGEARYTRLAQAAVRGALRDLDENPSRKMVVGGFTGWGGVVYALAHLGRLWQDEALLDRALRYVQRFDALIDSDDQVDVLSGAAGCILGLLSLYNVTGEACALEAAVACGARLCARASAMPRGLAWRTALAVEVPLTGFSHGAAGIAAALMQLWRMAGGSRHRRVALAAIEYERGVFSEAAANWPDLRPREGTDGGGTGDAPGFMAAWCHGAAGIGLGRLECLDAGRDDGIAEEIEVAVETTIRDGFGFDHSLCHGDLGNIELLARAHGAFGRERWAAAKGRLAGGVLAAIASGGARCGTPLRAESPGLMTGLSGIGYGLLRLAYPVRVPSVLTLERPRAITAAGRGR